MTSKATGMIPVDHIRSGGEQIDPTQHTVMAASQLDIQIKYGVYIPYDDVGYWSNGVTFHRNFSVWGPKPGWATHVVWIEK